MGGGTTLVEGARLGMQMTGIDLNPVAWFVCKNELAGSDPKQVEALFAEIEKRSKTTDSTVLHDNLFARAPWPLD